VRLVRGDDGGRTNRKRSVKKSAVSNQRTFEISALEFTSVIIGAGRRQADDGRNFENDGAKEVLVFDRSEGPINLQRSRKQVFIYSRG